MSTSVLGHLNPLAQCARRAECLDGGEPSDDCAAPRHAPGAKRQGTGDDRRQPFGDGGDREGDTGEGGGHEGAVVASAPEEHDQDEAGTRRSLHRHDGRRPAPE